jgi:hypothetical protein
MSTLMRAKEENLNAAVRRVARAALEMEDATANLRVRQSEWDEAVRAGMERARSEKSA